MILDSETGDGSIRLKPIGEETRCIYASKEPFFSNLKESPKAITLIKDIVSGGMVDNVLQLPEGRDLENKNINLKRLEINLASANNIEIAARLMIS